jgi:hypothetical protein
MKHPAKELKSLSLEENFAIAALYKQKECLKTWLSYLNVKNIHLPEEREKYRVRITQINDAIKILEEEQLQSSDAQSLEKNLLTKSSNTKTPISKNNRKTSSNSNSFISKAKMNQFQNTVMELRHELHSADN